MSTVYVTSFGPEQWTEYAEDFLKGWATHAKPEDKLLIYYEGVKPQFDDDRIIWHDLLEDPDLKHFLATNPEEGKNGIFTKEDGTKFSNYRFQAVKFARKVFAYTSFNNIPLCDNYIWIDADVEIFSEMPEWEAEADFLVHYIGRTAWDHSECGFLLFNPKHARFKEFLASMRAVYATNNVFTLPEWHDSFVFDRVKEAFEVDNVFFNNIAHGIDEMHPWDKTVLGRFSKHNKGPLAKMAQQQRRAAEHGILAHMGRCVDRYEQVTRVIALLKPQNIVEIGTWNGERAKIMATEALAHKETVHYIGFDLFEDATVENDKLELNVKKHSSVEDVQRTLSDFATKNPGFSYELHKGNTRNTAASVLKDVEIDFAFVDGGHSIETIQSDFDAVKHAKIVLLDDYFHGGADTEKFGCNKVVQGIKHVLLPHIDRYQGGLEVGQALVGDAIVVDDTTPPPIPKKAAQPQPMEIKTKNCVEDSEIHDNIRYSDKFVTHGRNLEISKLRKRLKELESSPLVYEMPPACKASSETAILVGGSDSWMGFSDRISHLSGDSKVFATKSSHDDLIEKGIIPWGCFLLDPRDHVEGCIKNFHPDVRYFVASMCHPSTWDRVTRSGAKIFRYHAGVHAGEDKVIAELGGGNMIFGGTTAGMRGMNVLYMMGFRNFDLYGFDSSYSAKPATHHGRTPKPVIKVNVNGREFITDPELVAQSKDIETFMKMMPDSKITVNGDSMLAWAVQIVKKADKANANTTFAAWAPYENAMKLGDELQESFWIDNAIKALQARRKKVAPLKEKLPRFSDFVAGCK